LHRFEQPVPRIEGRQYDVARECDYIDRATLNGRHSGVVTKNKQDR
jgi:hypothetical protein